MAGTRQGKGLVSAVELSHILARERAAAGLWDAPEQELWAVDATAGNGHDTLFLAKLVGPNGQVAAFDVQEEALSRVRRALQAQHAENAASQAPVELIHAGHERLREELRARHPPDREVSLALVMFNLGYLPRGDKSVITRGHTTLPALRQALELLSPGGLLTMVLYRGHPGGNEEAGAVLEEAEQLDPKQFQIAHWRGLGQHRAPPPELLAVVRRG